MCPAIIRDRLMYMCNLMCFSADDWHTNVNKLCSDSRCHIHLLLWLYLVSYLSEQNTFSQVPWYYFSLNRWRFVGERHIASTPKTLWLGIIRIKWNQSNVLTYSKRSMEGKLMAYLYTGCDDFLFCIVNSHSYLIKFFSTYVCHFRITIYMLWQSLPKFSGRFVNCWISYIEAFEIGFVPTQLESPLQMLNSSCHTHVDLNGVHNRLVLQG